jgi:hypothetical protein
VRTLLSRQQQPSGKPSSERLPADILYSIFKDQDLPRPAAKACSAFRPAFGCMILRVFQKSSPLISFFSPTRKPWQTTDYQGGEQLSFVCACLTLPDIKVVNLSSKAAKLRYADATFFSNSGSGQGLVFFRLIV